MSDVSRIKEQLRRALETTPALRPLFVKLARRLERNSELKGRMKLGNRLPADVLNSLRRLLPGSAVDVRPNYDVILRLDKIASDQTDEKLWIDAICTVVGVADDELAGQTLTVEDWQRMIDRGRLQYPQFKQFWDRLADMRARYLGSQRQRSSDDVQSELFALAKALTWLRSDHEPIGLMELSARIFSDSKVLKTRPALLRALQDGLIVLRDGEVEPESFDALRTTILSEHGVFDNATGSKVTVFGPLVYVKHGEMYDWIARLHAAGESATLSWDNLRDIEKIELPLDTEIITCENETPFNHLIRERHPGLIVYTAGYPNSAVNRLIRLLPPENGPIRHWGDSDFDGFLIASMLHEIRPVRLWRCDLATLHRCCDKMRAMDDGQRSRAEALLEQRPDFVFGEELQFSMHNGWLEQESWIPNTQTD
ncbi:hypothetical protein BMS3Bbin04_00467 [bacterium BMS3Bbin04]|nr:hypothetical protein BMS3Bbin04_00467 [bacterium BMS3Bbin04]